VRRSTDDGNKETTKALVLGGGGTTGIAWEMGLLLGLHKVGIGVTDADLIIGTSAGSVVGAQITSGLNLEDLYALQIRPLEETIEKTVSSALFDREENTSRAGRDLRC
jgi:NTE family protein